MLFGIVVVIVTESKDNTNDLVKNCAVNRENRRRWEKEKEI